MTKRAFTGAEVGDALERLNTHVRTDAPKLVPSKWKRWHRVPPCLHAMISVSFLHVGLLFGVTWAAPEVRVGSVAGYPGFVVELPVTLENAGDRVSSLGHTFMFDPRYTPVERNSEGDPDCVADPRLTKPVRFAFWPPGCAYELETCDAVRSLMIDLSGQSGAVSSGPLYRCRVRIAANAPAGTYPVELRHVEAAARGGTDLGATGISGSVTVLNPPGGGGCAVMGTELGTFPGFTFLGAFFSTLMAWVARRRGASRHHRLTATIALGRSSRRALAALVAATAMVGGGVAVAQQTTLQRLAVGGTWSSEGLQGSWHGQVGVSAQGSISGAVEFEGLPEKAIETVNLLAVWKGGRITSGSLFDVKGIAWLGALRGSMSLDGLNGWAIVSGRKLQWRLETVRSLDEKPVPTRVVEALRRGEPVTLSITFDWYEARRRARGVTADLSKLEWEPAARALYESDMCALKRSVLGAFTEREVEIVGPSYCGSTELVRVRELNVFYELLKDPRVKAIHDGEKKLYPQLAESLPLIRQPQAVARGVTGQWFGTIAVLDTGLDWTHAAWQSLFCQGGDCRIAIVPPDFAPEDGQRDDASLHGTHVAGIAAATAPETWVVPADVFYRDPNTGELFTVAGYYEPAVRWLLERRDSLNPLVINMSFGGGLPRGLSRGGKCRAALGGERSRYPNGCSDGERRLDEPNWTPGMLAWRGAGGRDL